MARIKFGSIVTEGSGKLGGHLLQNSFSGAQLRNSPVPLRHPSNSQLLIRSINKKLQEGWRSLTELERFLWNNFPSTPLAGHSLWMKYNFVYLSNNLPLITSPYEFKAEPLGPELIVNGSFSTSASWNFQGSFSWVPGFAFKATGAGGYFYQNIPDQSQGSFILTIAISDCIGSAQLSPYRTGPAPFFSPVQVFNLFPGAFVYHLLGSTNGIAEICLFSNQQSSQSFKVTNISLRKIL
jgi:hypothetical protein